jgi:CMP/dCMP kinase
MIIAIDGPAGSGKSTIAQALAKRLDWSFLDTGAMYRSVAWLALAQGVDLHDERAVSMLAHSAVITTLPRVTVNGNDVTDLIRSADINEGVSIVATQPTVREAMVARQREFAEGQPRGTVVEGRDITTVVFPDATLKVFLTASLEERARRRGDESAASLERRDRIDSTREASPMKVAEDARILDTTGRSINEIVEEIITWLPTN